MREFVSDLYRRESRRVFSTLVRLLGDFDLAEEALHEAFAAAIEQWQNTGVPAKPVAWLVATGRFKAIDEIRRRSPFRRPATHSCKRLDELSSVNAERGEPRDRGRPLATGLHLLSPGVSISSQVAMTLREVCGLTTEQIAGAFLTTAPTVAQRIVRAKTKIRDARIPFEVPSLTEFPERLTAVLSVIYLVFNEGYSASSGDSLTRPNLSAEAIRLARLLLELLPDPEVMGLLSLMLLHESRRAARTTPAGDIVLLEDQDRSRWDQGQIAEGKTLVERSLASRDSEFTHSRRRSRPSTPTRLLPRRPTGLRSWLCITCCCNPHLRRSSS